MIYKLKDAYQKAGNILLYLIYEHFYLITAALITVISLAVRYCAALHPTRDVVAYVFKWMSDIEAVGFSSFYTIESDYSPLFLFIVGLYTFLPKGEIVTVS